MPALQAWIFGPLILCLNANRGQELGKVIRALKFIPVTSIFAGCLVLFPPCCLGSPSAVPRAVDDQSIASDITIQPGGGVEMLNPTTACYNFGQVSLPVAQPIRTDFILKSTARTTITVDHITASCPCTTVSVQAPTSNRLPFAILPGQQFEVQVSVDPTGIEPGPMQRSVAVYQTGVKYPVATLVVGGTLSPTAAIRPNIVDFGRLTYGTTPKLPISIALTTNAVPLSGTLKFSSTNPNLIISADPENPPHLTASSLITEPVSADRTYLLTLTRNPALGRLDGVVYVLYTPSNSEQSVIVGSIKVRGELVGALSASLSSIVFKQSNGSQPQTQKITVYGQKPTDLQGLQVVSSTPLVVPKISDASGEPSTTRKPAPSTVVELKYSSQQLQRLLEGSITVSNAAHQRLIIPMLITPDSDK